LSLALLCLLAANLPARGAELTNTAQIRQLGLVEAKEGQTVRLRGVVTYSDPPRELLVVQDNTGGICVRVPTFELPIARGLLVTIEGVTAPGDFGPIVDKAFIRVLEKSSLPEAKPVTMEELTSGRFDALRVEVQCIVGSVNVANGRPALHLHQGRNSLGASLKEVAPNDPDVAVLVDAEVRVRGIAKVMLAPNGRSKRVELLVPDLDEVIVDKPAPAIPFEIPFTPVGEVAFSEESHRVKLLAQVVSVEADNQIVVKDSSGQISVRAAKRIQAEPGDLVEVLGFVMEQRGTTVLDHGVARVIAPAFQRNPAAAERPQSSTQPQLPVLQTIAEVSHLSPEEGERGYPVRLRGIVTFYDAPWHMLFIRDATNGIFVWPDQTNFNLQPGQIVEVAGFSSPGEYVPTVIKARVTGQIQSELPGARSVPYEVLVSGQEDSQWVWLDGIVRNIRVDGTHLVLDIAAGGGRCDAFVSGYTNGFPTNRLIDAEVRLHGVCSVIPNKRRQAIGFRLFVPSPAQITVRNAAPIDPFASPVRTVESLFRFGSAGRPGHRVRVSGVITMVRGTDSFFLHDGTGGLHVERIDAGRVQPGDKLEVVGFPAIVARVPQLQNGIFRRIATGPVPAPRSVNLQQALAGQFDAEPVTTSARLVEVTESADQPTLILQMDTSLVEAVFPASARAALKRLILGSLLQVTGIASTQFDEQGQARSFRLLVPSSAGVQVLRRPPWWALRHALLLAGILGLSVLGALGWVGSLRKRVQEQTRTIRQTLEQEARLESRYRELFENARDIIYTTDAEGKITSFNRAAELVTGYSRAEAMGRNLAELIAPRHATSIRKLAAEARDGEGKAVRELELIAKGGHRIPVEVDTQLLMENGRAVGTQGIARNIAERKRVEKAIHEMNATLERRVSERTAELAAANRELEAFSYSVSHDLRAPLRAINGFAEILLKDHSAHLEPKGHHYLRNVADSGRKMGQLVDDLLAFSRLNRHPLTKASLDMNRLAREVADDLQRQEAAHVVSIEITPLPFARGDRALVQQVLYNLLSNAWKFTSRTPCPTIQIGFRQDGEEIIYHVKDNGAGFDMKYAGKLFGVFQRLHRNDEFPGTGVGLAIVHRIITRHGGRIWAESRLNEGTTFYFTLPDDSNKQPRITAAHDNGFSLSSDLAASHSQRSR
jgi:PAS domain S-box-containing protein